MLVQTLLIVLAIYGTIGCIAAVPFVLVGARRLDPAAAATPFRVRAILLPGAAALWPVLAVRWLQASSTNRTSAGAGSAHAAPREHHSEPST